MFFVIKSWLFIFLKLRKGFPNNKTNLCSLFVTFRVVSSPPRRRVEDTSVRLQICLQLFKKKIVFFKGGHDLLSWTRILPVLASKTSWYLCGFESDPRASFQDSFCLVMLRYRTERKRSSLDWIQSAESAGGFGSAFFEFAVQYGTRVVKERICC